MRCASRSRASLPRARLLAWKSRTEDEIESIWNGKFRIDDLANDLSFGLRIDVTLEGPFDQAVTVAARPGDCELCGGSENRIAVEYGLQVFRPSGKLLYEEPKAASAEETSFYPKRYVPGVLNLRLQGLPAGEYPITVKVKDLIGSQEFEAKFPFRVE